MSANVLPFRVYQILSDHSDCDHALPPGVDLARYVRERFGMEARLRDNGDGTFDAVGDAEDRMRNLSKPVSISKRKEISAGRQTN